jgi:acyl carrier protein
LREAIHVLLCANMLEESLEARVERLVLEYAQSLPKSRPLDPRLSLRDDLVIESLSLVSLTLQLGDELGVNVVDLGIELGELRTLGDLVSMARTLSGVRTQETLTRSA